jgi:hypothetical protein
MDKVEKSGGRLMRVHAFRGGDGLIGLTPIPDGTNLPSRDGPWRYWKALELDEQVPVLGLDPRRALADIHERGWHLVAPR